MTRFINIPDYTDFFKTIKLSLNNFSVEMGVTAYSYFADKLFISSKNKHTVLSNLLNTNTGKDLKVRELLLLLDNLQGHEKPILDYICNRYGFVCSLNVKENNETNENIKDLLLKISGSNGSIINDYISFNSDDELDDNEVNQLLKASYNIRALLNQFEQDLKEKI